MKNLDFIYANSLIQLEEGTISTTYEPYYTPSTIPMPQLNGLTVKDSYNPCYW